MSRALPRASHVHTFDFQSVLKSARAASAQTVICGNSTQGRPKCTSRSANTSSPSTERGAGMAQNIDGGKGSVEVSVESEREREKKRDGLMLEVSLVTPTFNGYT